MTGNIQPRKEKRFQLGVYQHTKTAVLYAELSKKAENDQKIQNLKAELNRQENELQDLTKELHSKQALISKRKRKVCKFKKYL